MSSITLSHPILLNSGLLNSGLLHSGLPDSGQTGRAGGFGAGDPFVHCRTLLWSGDRAMAAGHVAWSGGTTETPAYPFTELLIVESGELTLALTGDRDKTGGSTLEPGQAAVLPRGRAVALRAEAPVAWRFCAARADMEADPAPMGIAVDPAAALSPSAAPAAEVLLGPSPSCRSLTQFADAATDLRIGVWDSTPYDRRMVPHRMNELMHILEGTVELTAADGVVLRASVGDTLFVPRGMPCAWTSTVTVRKIFAVQG